MQEAQLLSARRTFIICKARIYHLQGTHLSSARQGTKSSTPQNKILCRREQNFFKGLEIYFKSLEIYFKGFEIYFQGTEIICVRAATNLCPQEGEIVSARRGKRICMKGSRNPSKGDSKSERREFEIRAKKSRSPSEEESKSEQRGFEVRAKGIRNPSERRKLSAGRVSFS